MEIMEFQEGRLKEMFNLNPRDLVLPQIKIGKEALILVLREN